MNDQVENHEIEEGTIAADSLHPAAKSGGDDPKSKFSYIASMIGAMHAMKKEDLVDLFNKTQAVYAAGKDHGVGDKSGSNQSSIDMHGSAAEASSAPKTRMPMPKLNVREDVEEMFNGEELTEEFKDKASTLFEAAVEARVIAEYARLEEEFETKLTEAVAEINEELTSKVDAYLDYVVENWMEENQLAIESGLRTEIAEGFIESLKSVFEEHYIDIPEEKFDVVEELASKVEALEKQVNEQMTKNIDLKQKLSEQKKVEALHSVCEGLTLSQAEKIKTIAESVEFVSESDFVSQMEDIKESYFSTASSVKPASKESLNDVVDLNEEVAKPRAVDPMIAAYASRISQTILK